MFGVNAALLSWEEQKRERNFDCAGVVPSSRKSGKGGLCGRRKLNEG